MNNELIGIISNEGELKGVIEDNSFNVIVQIAESGPRGLPGDDGYTPIKDVDYFDGKDGTDGINGKDGTDGINGKDGVDGYTPIKGIDYFDGKDGTNGINGKDGANGIQGANGTDGINGKDGYTPQKGVDYYTDDDKAEMVSVVMAALPVYDGEVESV